MLSILKWLLVQIASTKYIRFQNSGVEENGKDTRIGKAPQKMVQVEALIERMPRWMLGWMQRLVRRRTVARAPHVRVAKTFPELRHRSKNWDRRQQTSNLWGFIGQWPHQKSGYSRIYMPSIPFAFIPFATCTWGTGREETSEVVFCGSNTVFATQTNCKREKGSKWRNSFWPISVFE